MKRLSIWYLEDFSDISERDLLKERGFGLGTVNEIKSLLRTVGLKLK